MTWRKFAPSPNCIVSNKLICGTISSCFPKEHVVIRFNNTASKILFVNEDSQDFDVFKVYMNYITGTRIYTPNLHQGYFKKYYRVTHTECTAYLTYKRNTQRKPPFQISCRIFQLVGKSGGKGSSACERLNNFDTYVPRADNKNRRNVESWTSKQGNKYSTAFCMKLQRAVSCIVQQTTYNRKIWRDKYLRGWPLKNLRVISEFPGVSVAQSFFYRSQPLLHFLHLFLPLPLFSSSLE